MKLKKPCALSKHLEKQKPAAFSPWVKDHLFPHKPQKDHKNNEIKQFIQQNMDIKSKANLNKS